MFAVSNEITMFAMRQTQECLRFQMKLLCLQCDKPIGLHADPMVLHIPLIKRG